MPVIKVDPNTKRLQKKREDIDVLYNMLQETILNAVRILPEMPEDAEHPASSPVYWISKWVDYSDKYGIGKSYLIESFPNHAFRLHVVR